MEGELRVIREGRPFANPNELPSDWKETVIDLYSRGASDVEVKAWIWKMRGSFSNDLFDRWMKDEPEFSETIKVGRMISEAWYNKVGRENLQNKDFNFTGWYMQMKNRFGWRDKSDVQHTLNDSIDGFSVTVNHKKKDEAKP